MFSWSSSNDIDQLIAKKKYARAAEMIRAELKREPDNVRLRQQLADVYVLDEKPKEAAPILVDLANEYVRAGFDAKGIALLKRIQRIDPGHRKVEEQLASLIRRGQKPTSDLRSRLPKPEPGEGAAAPLPQDDDQGKILRLREEAHGHLPPDVPREVVGMRRSQLFSDFSLQELLAVIDGLQLKTYAPGEIIITEGEPGNSLFVLASGAVRVYVRNTWGHNELVRILPQGEFFGEISLLTGQPRTATVTTCGPCEILELDRPSLDQIAVRNPKVPKIVRDLCDRRANSPEEIEARGELPELPGF